MSEPEVCVYPVRLVEDGRVVKVCGMRLNTTADGTLEHRISGKNPGPHEPVLGIRCPQAYCVDGLIPVNNGESADFMGAFRTCPRCDGQRFVAATSPEPPAEPPAPPR